MVRVKNGKLVASNISFALPEDFYLTLQPTGCGVHLLEFKSDKRVVKGGIIYIDIEFENAELTAKEAMEEFAGDCDLHIKGDFKPITRGKGTALSVHYYGGAYSDTAKSTMAKSTSVNTMRGSSRSSRSTLWKVRCWQNALMRWVLQII